MSFFYGILIYVAGMFTGVFIMCLMAMARERQPAVEYHEDEESVVP